MARPRAGTTPAIVAAQRAGVAFALHTYEHDASSTAYGAEAVERLGLDPARVFKTIVVIAGEQPAVAVVPVGSEVDLKALATVLGAKHATLASVADAERLTGYVVGGISPLGQKRRLPTVLDASAEACATVYVSAGRRGLEIELSAAALVACTNATVAEISR